MRHVTFGTAPAFNGIRKRGGMLIHVGPALFGMADVAVGRGTMSTLRFRDAAERVTTEACHCTIGQRMVRTPVEFGSNGHMALPAEFGVIVRK